MYKKKQIMCYLKAGLSLFKGPCLLFLQNVQGVTFIQAAIPDSRVGTFLQIEAYACDTEFQGFLNIKLERVNQKLVQVWEFVCNYIYRTRAIIGCS